MFFGWEHWQLIAHYDLLWTNFPAMPSLYHSSGLIALCLYHAVFQLFPGHWFSGTISTHMKTNRWLEWAQIKWVVHYSDISNSFRLIIMGSSLVVKLIMGLAKHDSILSTEFLPFLTWGWSTSFRTFTDKRLKITVLKFLVISRTIEDSGDHQLTRVIC